MLLRRNQRRRPDGGADRPRAASGAGRTRCLRRTRRRRDRSSRTGADGFGTRLDERELEPELLLAAARGRQLGGHVDADGACTLARQPRGDVCRAAAELDDVEPVDLAQRAERRLRDPVHAPRDLLPRPGLARVRVRVLGVRRSPRSSRLRRASSDRSPTTVRPGRREEQRELALRAPPRIRAVDDVLRELGGEVASNRPRQRVRRVGRAHQRPHARDRVLATDREREHGPEVMNETSPG